MVSNAMLDPSNLEHNDDAQTSDAKLLTGAEPFVAGIAPNYWAHVPMTIASLQALELFHGINCWTIPETAVTDSSSSYVPVSRCRLVGCIVNATTKTTDGGQLCMYVLDDGTGFVDCLSWSCEPQHDLFALPTLFDFERNDDDEEEDEHFNLPQRRSKQNLVIGDMVRVFGKIQCISANSKGVNGNESGETSSKIIREVVATLIEPLEDPILQEEVEHWKACSDHHHAMVADPRQWNALGFLERLGPKIAEQVYQRKGLPAADDTLGAWRVFGAACKCTTRTCSYKLELLYCHCKALSEPLDSTLEFRDALLNFLVRWQTAKPPGEKLIFPYKTVKADRDLRKIAAFVLSDQNSHVQSTKRPATQSNLGLLVDRLFLNTFRALRRDGILYLNNQQTDEYLLLSRTRVLEPYVRDQMSSTSFTPASGGIIAASPSKNRNFISLDGAPFLSKIHYDRLLYIRRCLTAADIAET